MPLYKVQREYTNWEQITIEADSKEEALSKAEDHDWEYATDVDYSHNYTGEMFVGEPYDEAGELSNENSRIRAVGERVEMSEGTPTPFSNKVKILAELWNNHREDPEYTDLIEYGDLGFPLAFAFYNEIAKPTELAEKYIDELWGYLLAGFDLEDLGCFEILGNLYDAADYGRRFSLE
jgi:hypothetical protein